MQQSHDFIAGKGAIEPRFYRDSAQCLAYAANAMHDKLLGIAGIMNVARPMVKIQYLACLGNGTEQRIIAALAFLLFVEPNSATLGASSGTQHRSIKIKGDPHNADLSKPSQDQLPVERSDLFDAVLIDYRHSSAYRCDIWKSPKT